MPPRADENKPKLSIRDATPYEIAAVIPPQEGRETWMAVLLEGETKVGQICVSRAFGEIFGHEYECSSKDPSGATRLWRAGVKKYKQWGGTRMHIHIMPGSSRKVYEFYEARGFKLEYAVLVGDPAKSRL